MDVSATMCELSMNNDDSRDVERARKGLKGMGQAAAEEPQCGLLLDGRQSPKLCEGPVPGDPLARVRRRASVVLMPTLLWPESGRTIAAVRLPTPIMGGHSGGVRLPGCGQRPAVTRFATKASSLRWPRSGNRSKDRPLGEVARESSDATTEDYGSLRRRWLLGRLPEQRQETLDEVGMTARALIVNTLKCFTGPTWQVDNDYAISVARLRISPSDGWRVDDCD